MWRGRGETVVRACREQRNAGHAEEHSDEASGRGFSPFAAPAMGVGKLRVTRGMTVVTHASVPENVLIRQFSDSVRALRIAGILRSRQIAGDLGEWMVETLYGGTRPPSRTNKGWDIHIPGDQRLQVKTQSDDPQNKWNYFTGDTDLFDRFIVLVLNQNWLPVELYDVPSGELKAVLKVTQSGKSKGQRTYRWDDLVQWRVDPRELPGYSKMEGIWEDFRW